MKAKNWKKIEEKIPKGFVWNGNNKSSKRLKRVKLREIEKRRIEKIISKQQEVEHFRKRWKNGVYSRRYK